jgi:hypothetical protein
MRSAKDTASAAIHRHERQLESLIDRLPNGLQASTRWLRRPSSRWARIPAGVLLIGGGVLSILPFLGLWMLPLGVILLAEDIPPLRRARARLLDLLERRRPHWFTISVTTVGRPTTPQSRSADTHPRERADAPLTEYHQ